MLGCTLHAFAVSFTGVRVQPIPFAFVLSHLNALVFCCYRLLAGWRTF